MFVTFLDSRKQVLGKYLNTDETRKLILAKYVSTTHSRK